MEKTHPDSFFRNRRFGFGLLAGLVVFALYIGWWYSIALHAERYFRTWQAGLPAQGASASARISLGGFPFAVVLHAHDFVYEKPNLLKISSPDLMVRLRPWTPYRPTAMANDPTTFEFQKAGYNVKVDHFEISFVKPWIGPYGSHDTGLVINAHFYSTLLDERRSIALGNTVNEASFTAKVKGFPPDIFSTAALTAWRDGGSNIEFPWLKMVWGPLKCDGSGTLALDKALQPQAAFEGRVAGYDKAIDALRDGGQIKPLVASFFKAALKLLENHKKSHEEEPTVPLPITIQNNALSVAGVVLARWEPFPWPEKSAD
ncbi:MAG TPA: DUF2125 domain-containing protein, partial [Alphaproteobacteria bacterium]|nr:DUF2125 domain-containing protein [Alphaproteobacteria bacterium]